MVVTSFRALGNRFSEKETRKGVLGAEKMGSRPPVRFPGTLGPAASFDKAFVTGLVKAKQALLSSGL